jgi:hypothetical protein
MNEAMNQSIAKFAPKGRDFSRTGSLHRRIMAAVGTNTGGMHYFSTVLEKIGCCPPPAAQDLFFDTRDHRNEYGFRYKSQPCNKRKRSAENVAKMSVQAKEKKTEPEYRTGIALEINFGTDDPALPTNSATTATAATSKEECRRCGGTDHKRSSSKKCPHNKDRKLPPGE